MAIRRRYYAGIDSFVTKDLALSMRKEPESTNGADSFAAFTRNDFLLAD
jgi:hypothetical protein